MKRTIPALALLSLGTLATYPVAAIPVGLLDQDGGFIEVNASLITGVAHYSPLLDPNPAQGTPVAINPLETIENKSYTAVAATFGSFSLQDSHESYVEAASGAGGTRFANATANAAGDLEVGIDGWLYGTSVAVARYSLEITNYRSRPVDLDFAFTIPEGALYSYDPALYYGDHPLAAKTMVGANIDGVLLTPAGPFGGHYDETLLPDMFDFFVEMRGAGERTCFIDDPQRPLTGQEGTCEGKMISYSPNAFPLLEPGTPANIFSYGFLINEYEGLLRLPTLEPFAKLTLYYDMYAQVHTSMEQGGRAMLGDPFTLSGTVPVRIVEHFTEPPPVSVPEPPAFLLAAAGLLGLGLARRRKLCKQES